MHEQGSGGRDGEQLRGDGPEVGVLQDSWSWRRMEKGTGAGSALAAAVTILLG